MLSIRSVTLGNVHVVAKHMLKLLQKALGMCGPELACSFSRIYETDGSS